MWHRDKLVRVITALDCISDKIVTVGQYGGRWWPGAHGACQLAVIAGATIPAPYHVVTLIARLMGQHGAHLGPTGPRWVSCWPHEPCYLGKSLQLFLRSHTYRVACLIWIIVIACPAGSVLIRGSQGSWMAFIITMTRRCRQPLTNDSPVYISTLTEGLNCATTYTRASFTNRDQLNNIRTTAWTSCKIRKIAVWACAGNAGNVFPATAGKRPWHASRHVRHARAVMHVGIAN